MLAKVIIENGQKKIQALTADTGTGAPVGSYLYLEKKSNPQGYLYCDGSTFDETVYPALYQYLGTNVLPDWREFSAVGAEQNTTSSVIATHDVFTQGQEKDDCLQEHNHDVIRASQDFPASSSAWVLAETATTQYGKKDGVVDVTNARSGNVTRGKRKAVFIYIKATSGLTENQQENVLNTINENNSYSTEEHLTGKKWIDGKPIYSKVIENPANNVPFLSDVAEVVEYRLKRTYDSENLNAFVYEDGNSSTNSVFLYLENGNLRIIALSGGFTSVMKWVYVEYTKTV